MTLDTKCEIRGGGSNLETIQEIKRKNFLFKGFGFRYVKARTNENDLISGGSLYVCGKQVITVAISNTKWVDEQGIPYNFKFDEKVLYIGKLAIGVSS